jgi:hypothetical protein
MAGTKRTVAQAVPKRTKLFTDCPEKRTLAGLFYKAESFFAAFGQPCFSSPPP